MINTTKFYIQLSLKYYLPNIAAEDGQLVKSQDKSQFSSNNDFGSETEQLEEAQPQVLFSSNNDIGSANPN